MDMQTTSIGNGSILAVSVPLALTVRLINNCGQPVNNATVLVDADGIIATLDLIGNGLYSTVWTPEREAPLMTLEFKVLHPTFGNIERTLTVSSTLTGGEANLPVIAVDGVVDAAGFAPRWPLAPGGMISIFGSRLADTEAAATAVPLPRELAGVRVIIGGEDAPLYFVGTGQINAQVPFGVRIGDSVSITVSNNGRLSAPQQYLIAPAEPGIFQAGGFGVALDGLNQLITLQNPARIGGIIQIFAAGLGHVSPEVETGAASPAFSTVQNPVTVLIGGVTAPVSYQGLAPDFVGLYQVNVFVPPNVPVGDAVPIVLEQGGIPSNAGSIVTIPVAPPGL
jgi:uncharacterized protein (TIGR03437 family)